MKKVVLQLKFEGGEIRTMAMGKVSKIKGVKRIEFGEDKKMTVIGDMDPVLVDKKLKTLCSARILHIGPAEAEETTKTDKGKNEVQQAAAAAAAVVPSAPPAVMTEIPPPHSHNLHFYDHQDLYYPPSAPPLSYLEYILLFLLVCLVWMLFN